MKKSILVILVFLFLMVVPMVFATTTIINIKTLANHDIKIKILDPYPREGESNLLEFLSNTSDENGLTSVESFTDTAQVDITVVLEKDGIRQQIKGEYLHKFEKQITGGIINLEIKEKTKEERIQELIKEKEEQMAAKENITNNGDLDVQVEITEEELETETNQEEIEKNKEGGKITGAVITGTKNLISSKTTYYIIGGILIAVGLFFVVRSARKKLKNKKGGSYINFKVKDKKDELNNKIEEHDDKLEDAEKKLQEAKQELDEIKNKKSKLQEAKERFEKAKSDLKRFEE